MTTRFGIRYIDRIWFQASAGVSPCFFFFGLEPTKMSAGFSRKPHLLQPPNSQRHLSLHANFTSDQMVKNSHEQCMLYPRACNPEQRNQNERVDLRSLTAAQASQKLRHEASNHVCLRGRYGIYCVPQPVSAGITFCCAELFVQIEGLNASGSSTYQNWRSVSESASRLTSLDLAMPLVHLLSLALSNKNLTILLF